MHCTFSLLSAVDAITIIFLISSDSLPSYLIFRLLVTDFAFGFYGTYVVRTCKRTHAEAYVFVITFGSSTASQQFRYYIR